MSKSNISRRYNLGLIKQHIISTILVLIICTGIPFILDNIFNGLVINLLERVFGYTTAFNVMMMTRDGRLYIILYTLFLIIIEFIVWIFIEFKYTRKLTNIITNMESFFESNEETIKLDKDFKELEFNLNKFRQESIRNAEKAEIEVQRKNDLITYLAHDIRTPLSSVIGYLSLLDEVPDLPIKQRIKYTNITLEKANRLEMLINEFFDITRFNLSSIPLEKEKINLNFMIEQLADEFYPILSKGGRSIELYLDNNMVIFADSNKLARVFSNLLKNAISYSYENSIIKIKAYEIEKNTIIEFENNGKVIPKQKLDNIFEKFFRLDQSRASNTGGAGLGLAIAKSIVVQHGGNISADSNEEKTTFIVTIPSKNFN